MFLEYDTLKQLRHCASYIQYTPQISFEAPRLHFRDSVPSTCERTFEDPRLQSSCGCAKHLWKQWLARSKSICNLLWRQWTHARNSYLWPHLPSCQTVHQISIRKSRARCSLLSTKKFPQPFHRRQTCDSHRKCTSILKSHCQRQKNSWTKLWWYYPAKRWGLHCTMNAKPSTTFSKKGFPTKPVHVDNDLVIHLFGVTLCSWLVWTSSVTNKPRKDRYLTPRLTNTWMSWITARSRLLQFLVIQMTTLCSKTGFCWKTSKRTLQHRKTKAVKIHSHDKATIAGMFWTASVKASKDACSNDSAWEFENLSACKVWEACKARLQVLQARNTEHKF